MAKTEISDHSCWETNVCDVYMSQLSDSHRTEVKEFNPSPMNFLLIRLEGALTKLKLHHQRDELNMNSILGVIDV